MEEGEGEGGTSFSMVTLAPLVSSSTNTVGLLEQPCRNGSPSFRGLVFDTLCRYHQKYFILSQWSSMVIANGECKLPYSSTLHIEPLTESTMTLYIGDDTSRERSADLN